MVTVCWAIYGHKLRNRKPSKEETNKKKNNNSNSNNNERTSEDLTKLTITIRNGNENKVVSHIEKHLHIMEEEEN